MVKLPPKRTGSRHWVGLGPLAGIALVLAACAPGPTAAPTSTSSPTVPSSSPSLSPTTLPSVAGAPGSILVLGCGLAPSAASVCLGTTTGTLQTFASRGANLTLTVTVSNPGTTASAPITLLLYVLDAGSLPFSQPVCRTCNTTTSRSIVGLEWAALSPGETRTVSTDLPITGSPGATAWFATLYAQPLPDVMTAEISQGIQPGQQTWKVATAIASP